MDVKPLILHLATIDQTRHEPQSVGLSVMRHFYIDRLKAEGVHGLEDLTDKELETYWHQSFWDEGMKKYRVMFQPEPNTYLLVLCYAQILRGLGYYQATAYKSDPKSLTTVHKDGRILETSASDLLGAHQALWFIGQTDDLIRNYLRRLEKQETLTSLEFDLDDNQLDVIRSLYKTLPPANRGLAGTRDTLRTAISQL